MDLGIATVVSIVCIVYLIGQVVKTTPLDTKYIPIICGVAGLILGIVGYYIGIPDFPAGDVFTAAAVGIASGFAATGVNQVYSKLRYSGSDTSTNEEQIEDDSDTTKDE